MKLGPELAALVEPIVDLVAERVAARLANRGDAGPQWVDAKSSGLGVRTFRRAARAGAFPVHLLGKRWVARRADVDAFIASQRVSFEREGRQDAADPFERAIASGRLRVVGGGRGSGAGGGRSR